MTGLNLRNEIHDNDKIKDIDSLRPLESRVLLRISELYAEHFSDPDYKQTNIAADLALDFPELKGLAPRTREKIVTSYMQCARRWRILRAIVNHPRHDRLQQSLKQRFLDQGISDVCVASKDGVSAVSQLAACFLSEHAAAPGTIVVDGGKTVRAILEQLHPVSMSMNFIPICSDPPTYEHSALNTVTRISSTFSGSSRVLVPLKNQRPFNQTLEKMLDTAKKAARSAKVVLLGAGPFITGNTAFDFVEQLGLCSQKLKKSVGKKVTAMCGYFPLGSNGQPQLIEELEQVISRSIDFNDLVEMTKSTGCKTILVASGRQKASAVHAVIQARLCNTIILDSEVADALRAQAG